MRVLAVEDCAADAELLRNAMIKASFDPIVERVQSGAALREALARRNWDLVISDSSLPGLNARAALEVVKERLPKVPFIVVSGSLPESEASAIIKAGAYACLAKDRLDELTPLIERALRTASGDGERTSHVKAQARPASEPDFQTLFESAPGLYLALTTDLRIVAVSEAYLRATMTNREAILGRGLFEVFPDNPNDPQASGVRNLKASLERVLRTGTADTMAVQKYDIRRPEAEGGGFEERFWSPVNCPVQDANGHLKYIIHRVADVTDFVRLKERGVEQSRLTEALQVRAQQMESEVFLRAQEVQRANEKLQAANEELARLYEKTKELEQLKTEFFANVSHELRTPLTLILYPAQRLLTAARIDETAARNTLESISRNSWLLLKHVNDLLDVSKLEAGQLKANYAPADLAQLLRLAGSHFEPLAAEKSLDFTIQTPAGIPAEVDAEKMQRVFFNLLSNAFKFTPPQGRIRCTLREEKELSVVLEVADSGPGIPPDFREAVFERFRQVHSGANRRFGGTGLGLAIAREFVGLHDGTILIGDAPEGGALFTVSLPRKAPEGTVLGAVTRQELGTEHLAQQEIAGLQGPTLRQVPGSKDPKSPLVLVIEDNAEMNRFICECLADEYRLEAAYDGKAGLEKAAALKPDLIVCDVMMPEVSGDMVVQALRSNRQLETTPVIMLSAKADDDMRVELLRAGAQDYIMKPFSADVLRARVGNLIAIKRANDRIRRLNNELAMANKELDAFSYSVSHDLRAPLRAVQNFSALLARDATQRLTEKDQELLGYICAGSAEMGQLINGLLNFSRFAREPLLRTPLNVGQLVREVLESQQQEQDDRQVEIHVGELPDCTADRTLLKQVFVNLLSNAFKYTRRREKAEITVGCEERQGEKVYFVRDNGAGFDMQFADKLFGVFQRLHDKEEFEGTGVGLSLVQRIIQRHGGRIWAEAEVEKGAVFYFTLPEQDLAVSD